MSKKLLSILRRILRSRETQKPNLLSFWLVCIVFSFLITKGGFAIFDVIKKREDENNKIAEIADWIHSEKPLVLIEHQNEFLEQYMGLANKIICCNNIDRGESLKPAGTLLGSRDSLLFSMFGIPDVVVDPRITTYSKSNNEPLTETEKKLFSNFANYMARFQRFETSPFKKHFEKFLSQQLGFKTKEDTISFNVPWIYLASSSGAIAVYPGTSVIAENSWEIRSRPWFEAAFSGETKLFASNVINSGDKLTVTYLDVLAKSPVLVRTYLYNITDSNERFVLAVDLHLENGGVFGENPLEVYSSVDSGTYFIDTLFGLERPSYDEIGLFIVCFLVLVNAKRFNSYCLNDIYFKRVQSVYGNVELNQTKSNVKSFKENRSWLTTFGVDLHWLGFSAGGANATRKKEEEDGWSDVIAVILESNYRGWEDWNVFMTEKTVWSVFGVSFENTQREAVGKIHLFYSRDILPKGRWVYGGENLGRKEDLLLSKDMIMKVLCRNADLSDDEFLFPTTSLNSKLKPRVPDYLRTAIDPLELMSVRQNRVYVKLVKEQIKELYSKASIKAVMTSGYFEQLLNRSQFDLLQHGLTIQRLISFIDETTTLNLSDRGKENLEQLKDFYFTSSRQLLRVNAPIQEHGSLVPVYDFAIINESIVLVAYSISENTTFDAATGKPGRSSFSIDGYLSWRRSDVTFYHALFEKLSRGKPTVF